MNINMEKGVSKKFLIGAIIVMLLGLGIIFILPGGDDKKKNSNEEEVQTGTGKQDFFIDIKRGSDFGRNSFLEKTGKVISQEDIMMNAQANGKISNIYVKEGQKVAPGQKLIALSDSVGSYGLNLEKANLGVESAQIDYNSQKVNLDKAVSDALINLEKTQIDYDATKLLLQKNLDQAKLNLDSSKNVDEDTTLSLQLQRAQNNFKKVELDVANLKRNNIEQLKSFKNSAISTYELLDNLILDIIDFSDGILGVTPQNKKLNDKFEDYLGRKDSVQLSETEQLLREFTLFKENIFDELDLKSIDFQENAESEYEKIFLVSDKGYDDAKILLKNLTKVFDNSVVSIGSLGQPEIASFKSQINGYETQTQQSFSSYLGFKSQVRTFLNTYKNTELVAEENLNLLQDELRILEKNKTISDSDFGTALENNEINYEKSKIDTQKQLKNLEISLKNARLVYDNAKKVRDVSLRRSNNAIKISKNSSSQAYKEYSKLSLKSPIYGVVTEIFTDKGQDVNVGSQIAKISSLSNTEAEISLSKDELNFVKVGEKIIVDYAGKQINGKVESISVVADENLMYKTKITFSQKFQSIGGLIDIKIPVETETILFPINMIEVIGEGKGKTKVLSGSTIEDYSLDLGKVWGDAIEIISNIDPNTQFIITNLSNYDSNRFDIKVKGSDESDTQELLEEQGKSKEENDDLIKKML